MDETFNRFEAAKAQREYCKKNQLPMFVSQSGYCHHCGGNVFDKVVWHGKQVSGYSVEDAGRRLITGCPHCNASFVD